MIAEFTDNEGILLSAEFLKKMGVLIGDKFDIIQKDGGIFLCPVVIYSNDEVNKIKKLVNTAHNDNVTKKSFDNVEDMFSEMGITLE